MKTSAVARPSARFEKRRDPDHERIEDRDVPPEVDRWASKAWDADGRELVDADDAVVVLVGVGDGLECRRPELQGRSNGVVARYSFVLLIVIGYRPGRGVREEVLGHQHERGRDNAVG